MKKAVWIWTVVILSSLMTCCGPKNDKKVKTWVYKPTALCQVKIKENVTALPFDMVFSVNRSDLERYDGAMSSRVWAITKDVQALEYGADLILTDKPGQSAVQTNGWTPDGSAIMINSSYEDAQHAMYEEFKGDFIVTRETHRLDLYRTDFDSGVSTNLTAIDEVSFYNYAANFSPALPGEMMFQAYVNNEARIYRMNEDGSNKRPLLQTSGFAYGLGLSPDGTKYAFHSEYKVYIGDFATGVEKRVESPCSFNFGPVWSPDSSHIVFSCGSSNVSPDLYTADRDGNNVKFLGSRNGYVGVVPFIDGYDFHGGGTDRFVWTPDSTGVIYGRNIIGSTELVIATLDGQTTQLTHSPAGSRNVYPQVSPDGQWLVFNARRNGALKQDTYIMNLSTLEETQVTDLDDGCNSRINYWRPN